MKKELFEELLQSVKEATAIEHGKIKPSRTFEMKTGNDVVRVSIGIESVEDIIADLDQALSA